MTKTAIRKRVEFWKNKLGLTNWDILITFKPTNYPKATEAFTGIAKTDCQSTYKLATMIFDPKQLRWVDDKVIIHELLHCLFSSLTGFARANFDYKKYNKSDNWLEYFEEQVVSEIERIIHRIDKKK